ncbi:hypothetical protein CC78DRAFT_581609 [Lojkania enalia]|uniref:Uncharacterized protein n=1 Tax=Lojkania enalia TaxID=147567 RepID=A0A9P4K759_9PLEO|nr:hypothetical protein CC78DRAFT_581609 [Didymosphaeria enalia]
MDSLKTAMFSDIVNTAQNLSRSPTPSSSPRKMTGSSPFSKLSPFKEKIPQDLKHALNLLRIRNLDGLEKQFLEHDAFLKPWCDFRDDFLLLHDDDEPTSRAKNIKRTELLWYYTRFDEGSRRITPIDDDTSYVSDLHEADQDAIDQRVAVKRVVDQGAIDKSNWQSADYEKFLYAWLLQSFCVGKQWNRFGFKYFECKNVCTAWEEVFIPIVRAVANDYSVKGRNNYGRLAKFIEKTEREKYRNRMAWPECNVENPWMEQGPKIKPPKKPKKEEVDVVPYGMFGFGPAPPRKHQDKKTKLDPEGKEESRKRGVEGLDDRVSSRDLQRKRRLEREEVKKEFENDDRELRAAFPGFLGQLIEKPKTDLPAWITRQKTILERRKALKGLEESSGNSFGDRVLRAISRDRSSTGSSSPSKRSLSLSGPSSLPKPIPCNTTYSISPSRVVAAGTATSPGREPSDGVDPSNSHTRRATNDSIASDKMAGSDVNRARKDSDGLYNSIRGSNPFTEDINSVLGKYDEYEQDFIKLPVPPMKIPRTTRSESPTRQHEYEDYQKYMVADLVGSQSDSGPHKDLQLSSTGKTLALEEIEDSGRATVSVDPWNSGKAPITGDTERTGLPLAMDGVKGIPVTRIPSPTGAVPHRVEQGGMSRAIIPTLGHITSEGEAIALGGLVRSVSDRSFQSFQSARAVEAAPKSRIPGPVGSRLYGSKELTTPGEWHGSSKAPQTRIPGPAYSREDNYTFSRVEGEPATVQPPSHPQTIPTRLVPSIPLPPPIPAKNPARYASDTDIRDATSSIVSSRFPRSTSKPPILSISPSTLGARIISKENIRSALSQISRENSAESLLEFREDLDPPLMSPKTVQAFAGIGGRGINTGEQIPDGGLETFNTHMFPRNGGAPRGSESSSGSAEKRYARVGTYEMDVFKRKERIEE